MSFINTVHYKSRFSSKLLVSDRLESKNKHAHEPHIESESSSSRTMQSEAFTKFGRYHLLTSQLHNQQQHHFLPREAKEEDAAHSKQHPYPPLVRINCLVHSSAGNRALPDDRHQQHAQLQTFIMPKSPPSSPARDT